MDIVATPPLIAQVLIIVIVVLIRRRCIDTWNPLILLLVLLHAHLFPKEFGTNLTRMGESSNPPRRHDPHPGTYRSLPQRHFRPLSTRHF